jgi:hypothetical protein
LSVSSEIEVPPDYNPAQKYPEAPRRALPVIIPIRPTLRRLQAAALREETQSRSITEVEQQTGFWWKACHTDIDGHWYKPHKAGPCMALLLVVGWIVFLLLFGWIIALALVLVGLLVLCAYGLNFACTGRCSIDDDDDD